MIPFSKDARGITHAWSSDSLGQQLGVFELTVYVLSVTSNNDNATYNIYLGVTCKEFSKCLVHCKFSVVYL